MTVIGAFNCIDGIALFADRQETITDYAKWDASKIGIYQLDHSVRVFMAGAGPANTCDMVWEKVVDGLFERRLTTTADIEDLIVRTVTLITKKRIFPYPSRERPIVDLIWVIQQKEPQTPTVRGHLGMIRAFRTSGLDVNEIRSHYFSGNPLLLMKFLSDMFLDKIVFTLAEAEALASYFLWEAKEYDPTCGKHSDIFLIRHDWTLGRLSRNDIRYWEEHFEHLKDALSDVLLLSCSGRLVKKHLDLTDHLERIQVAIKTLAAEQEKWRAKTVKSRSKLEEKLRANLVKVATKHQAKRLAKRSST